MNTQGLHTHDDGTAFRWLYATSMFFIVLGVAMIALGVLVPFAERMSLAVPSSVEASAIGETTGDGADGSDGLTDGSVPSAESPVTTEGEEADDGVVASSCPVTRVVATSGKMQVMSQKVGDDLFLFLPSQPKSASFRIDAYDGKGRQLAIAISDDETTVGRLMFPWSDFTAKGLSEDMARRLDSTGKVMAWVRTSNDVSQEPMPLTIMKSARTRFLFIRTGRPGEYVEQTKGNTATGHALAYDASGACVYDGELDGIRGRGNSTWDGNKKPYNIKLDRKADLVGFGEPCKSWCLLADTYDWSGLRNLVSLRLAKEYGIPETPDCAPCDLWWNGEYHGSYLVTEKVGIWSGGVDVRSLEDEMEGLNKSDPETAVAYESPQSVTEGKGDGDICYVEGVTAPQRYLDGDLEGLLVEFDGRHQGEHSWFRTSIGTFVMKSPSIASKDMVMIARDRFERAFSCLYAGGGPDKHGCVASDYFDLESLARCSWLYVLAGEIDYMGIGSSYFYIAEDGLIHAGPAWDFDLAWYNRSEPGWNDVEFKNLFERNVFDDGNNELRQVVSQIHPELSSLVRDILLGNKGNSSDDKLLHSLEWNWSDRERSRSMNITLWGLTEENQEDSFERFNRSLSERIALYDDLVEGWDVVEEPASGDAKKSGEGSHDDSQEADGTSSEHEE